MTPQELKETYIYKDLLKLGFPEEDIICGKFGSLCMEKSPNKIRIQNDEFLSQIKNGNFNVVLLSGTKIINKVGKQKIVFVVIYGESFRNYTFSVSSNNSFFIADFPDLKDWVEISQELINHSHKKYKKPTKKVKYSFHVSTESNIHTLKRHLGNLKEWDFEEKKPTKDKKIPKQTEIAARIFFSNKCGVFSINQQSCPDAYIFRKKQTQRSKAPTELHHLLTKEFWKSYFDSINKPYDWSLIHNQLNLIPLCPNDHVALHGGNKMVFDNIMQLLKKKKIYEKFFTYLALNTPIKNEIDLWEQVYSKKEE